MRAFVPFALPPADPVLSPAAFVDLNRHAELALARLAGVSGLGPSVDWLLYSAIRKEALRTSQIEGTQATLTDLFDEEAGFKVGNTEDVEDVTNYLRAFRWVQEQLRDPKGLPISVRLIFDAHRLLLDGARGAGWQTAGRTASISELGRRYTAGQCHLRAAAAQARARVACIVMEMTGQKKNRTYSYQAYVELLSR